MKFIYIFEYLIIKLIIKLIMNIELTDIVPGTCLDSDIQKLKCCSICLESKEEKLVSFCTSCIESGNSCHECEKKWVKQEKDPHICTICKSKTKQNISTEALRIYNSRNENNNNRERRETRETRERNLGSLNGRRATVLRYAARDLTSLENGTIDFEIGEIENQNYLRDDNNSRNSNNTSNNSEEVTFSDFNNPKKCCCWLSIILMLNLLL